MLIMNRLHLDSSFIRCYRDNGTLGILGMVFHRVVSAFVRHYDTHWYWFGTCYEECIKESCCNVHKKMYTY
jgi:hypothetical protein